MGLEVPERAQWIRMLMAEWNRVLNHLMFLGQGALWTIGLSVIALIGGGIVGFVIALARISPLKSVRIASAVYFQLIQGTPLLVILFLGYLQTLLIDVLDEIAPV